MGTIEFLKLILMTKRDRFFIGTILFFSLLLSLLEIICLGTLFSFLNIMQNPGLLAADTRYKYISAFLRVDSPARFIFYLGLLLMIVYICRGILHITATYVQNYFAYKKQTDISTELLDSYLKAPYRFHLEANSASLIKNVNVEVANIMLFLQETLSLVLESIILFFIVAFLCYLSWKVTAFLLIAAFVYHLGISKIFLRKIKLLGDRRENIQSRAFRNTHQALISIKNIKIDNKTDHFVNLFQDNLKEIIKVGSYFRTLTVSPKAIVETSIFLAAIIFLLVKINTTGFNPTLIPLIGVYGFAIYRIVPSINKITTIMMNMKFFKVSVDIVGNQIKSIRLKKCEEKAKIPKKWLNTKISVKGLTFRYSQSSDYLFKDVNLEIYRGEKILIVGESGAGKSTFIDLLTGLLEPEKGDILYDDVSVSDLDISELIGYLPQKVTLLDMDITGNIAFGEEKENIIINRLLTTLERVNLQDLSKSLDRVIGEDGVKLSGGQRQRIGAARIFYRDKDIIFLDEFSSALDRDNEKKLIEEIMNVFGNKTIIAVTHKTYLSPYFDKVYKKALYSLAEIDSKDLIKL